MGVLGQQVTAMAVSTIYTLTLLSFCHSTAAWRLLFIRSGNNKEVRGKGVETVSKQREEETLFVWRML